MEAKRKLRAIEVAPVPVSAQHLYDLTLLATGDKGAAERAFLAHRHAELQAGVTPS